MKINEKDTKQGIIPTLRFPEFSKAGEWAIVTLNKFASRISKKNNGHICRVLTNSAADGVVDQTDYFDRNIVSEKNLHNYYVIENGDYVYNPRISTSAPVGPISKNYIGQGVMSPLYTIFRFHNSNNEFYNQYFKTKYWHKYLKNVANQGARFDRMNITTDDFMNLPVPAPCQAEQQKIADCLSSIDALIKAAENKIDELKAHKKGLMQQLFPAEGETVPALRFPEFQDAGEWEEILMHQIGKMFSGLSGKNSSDFGRGKRYITYKQVYSDTVNDFDKCEKVLVRESEKQHYVQKGDILFTTSSETPNEVGISSVILESLSETIYLNSFCFILRPYDINKLYPKFARHLFRCQIYRNRINKLAQGAIRFNLSRNQFIKLSLPIPRDLKEQQKVADCLSSIDDLIAVQTNRLEALRSHKKGLMQQLFPNLNNHEE